MKIENFLTPQAKPIISNINTYEGEPVPPGNNAIIEAEILAIKKYAAKTIKTNDDNLKIYS